MADITSMMPHGFHYLGTSGECLCAVWCGLDIHGCTERQNQLVPRSAQDRLAEQEFPSPRAHSQEIDLPSNQDNRNSFAGARAPDNKLPYRWRLSEDKSASHLAVKHG